MEVYISVGCLVFIFLALVVRVFLAFLVVLREVLEQVQFVHGHDIHRLRLQ